MIKHLIYISFIVLAFSSTASATIVMETFESAAVGSDPTDLSTLSLARNMTVSDSNTDADRGDRTVLVHFEANSSRDIYFYAPEFTGKYETVDGDEYYVTIDWYQPSGFEWDQISSNDNVVKFLRIGKQNDDGDPDGNNSIFIHQQVGVADVDGYPFVNLESPGINYGREADYIDDPSTPVFADDTWNTIVFYCKMSETTGEVKMWLNDILYVEETGIATMNATHKYVNRIFGFSTWNGEPPTQDAYIDNFGFSYNETPTWAPDYTTTSSNTKLSNITTTNVTFT